MPGACALDWPRGRRPDPPRRGALAGEEQRADIEARIAQLLGQAPCRSRFRDTAGVRDVDATAAGAGAMRVV